MKTATEKKVRVYFTVSEHECIAFMQVYNEMRGTSWGIYHTEKLLYVDTYDNYIDFLCRLENAGISEFRVEDVEVEPQYKFDYASQETADKVGLDFTIEEVQVADHYVDGYVGDMDNELWVRFHYTYDIVEEYEDVYEGGYFVSGGYYKKVANVVITDVAFCEDGKNWFVDNCYIREKDLQRLVEAIDEAVTESLFPA